MQIKLLTEKAIKAALCQNWHLAIEYNLEILEKDPYHIPTLNRLAKAQKELGYVDKAIKTYEQALKYDRFNEIAKKNLEHLTSCQNGNSHHSNCKIDTQFIDEPGKTHTLPLTRLGDPDLINSLQPGQVVQMVVKKRHICVVTENEDHVGVLTDDAAYHLRDFLIAGNTYHTVIKRAQHSKIKIFIKEVKRVKEYRHVATFSTSFL